MFYSKIKINFDIKNRMKVDNVVVNKTHLSNNISSKKGIITFINNSDHFD